MYRRAYQGDYITIFSPGGLNSLHLWDVKQQDGWINTFLDQEIKTLVLDIRGYNISTCYMQCPKGKQVLGISLPFLVMIVKNLKKYFSFEITILDDSGARRRFRISNFQSTTQIGLMCTAMPLCLSDGWNQIQFNLADFTRRAYNRNFIEVQKIKINANIRIRKIYFAEKLVLDNELPPEYKLFSAPKKTKPLKSSQSKENVPEQPDIETTSQIITPERKGSKAKVITPTKKQSLQETLIKEVILTPVTEVAIVEISPGSSTKEGLCECEPPANGAPLQPCECKPEVEVTEVAIVEILPESPTKEDLCECEPPVNGAPLQPCECKPGEEDGPAENETSVVVDEGEEATETAY